MFFLLLTNCLPIHTLPRKTQKKTLMDGWDGGVAGFVTADDDEEEEAAAPLPSKKEIAASGGHKLRLSE